MVKKENQTLLKAKWSRTGFITLEIFNAFSALAGGFGLMTNPDGIVFGMDVSWLEGTPFSSFLIPGIVLFIVNGIGNSVGAMLSFRKNKMAPYVAAFFGFVMMVWIVSQVAWIGYRSFLQPLYFGVGIAQLILAYIFVVRNSQSKIR